MLSVMTLVPVESANVIAICGCISVGNPGYGSVLIFVLVKRSFTTTRTASSYSSIVAQFPLIWLKLLLNVLELHFSLKYHLL